MQSPKSLSIVMIIHDTEMCMGEVPPSLILTNFSHPIALLEINPTPIKPKQTSNPCQSLPGRMIYKLPAEHWCKQDNAH